MVRGSDCEGAGTRVVNSGALADTETDAVSVTLASGNNVVAAVGTTVMVVLGSLEAPGSSVKVAGTSAESVVESTGCRVTVVSTKGMLDGVDATGWNVRVAGASETRVVAAVGIKVTVVDASDGSAGCRVKVAGTSGKSVVGWTGSTTTVVGEAKETEADADTSKVRVAEGSSVVSSLGTITTVVGSAAGSVG